MGSVFHLSFFGQGGVGKVFHMRFFGQGGVGKVFHMRFFWIVRCGESFSDEFFLAREVFLLVREVWGELTVDRCLALPFTLHHNQRPA